MESVGLLGEAVGAEGFAGDALEIMTTLIGAIVSFKGNIPLQCSSVGLYVYMRKTSIYSMHSLACNTDVHLNYILYANTYTILYQELDSDSSSDLTFEYILPACARISHALESRFEPFLPLVSMLAYYNMHGG